MTEAAKNTEVEVVEEEEEVVETSLREDLESLYVDKESTDDSEKKEILEEVKEQKNEAKEGGDDLPGKSDEGAQEIAAPISYSPEAREAWKGVPTEVRSEIQRREKEIAEAVANTGEYRRTYQALDNLSKSYAAVMAAEGVSTPMEAVEGLFRTVAELRLGNPGQRAVKMAQLINHYGIDIVSLDKALAGEKIDPELDKFSKLLDQRLGPIEQSFQQRNVPDQSAAVEQELKTFAQRAEFINDVKEDMADLIELRARRGISMSFEDAYNVACANNPQISKILSDRNAAAALAAEGAETSKKVAASSSIPSSSSPGGIMNSAPKDSLRAEIDAAWDAASE